MGLSRAPYLVKNIHYKACRSSSFQIIFKLNENSKRIWTHQDCCRGAPPPPVCLSIAPPLRHWLPGGRSWGAWPRACVGGTPLSWPSLSLSWSLRPRASWVTWRTIRWQSGAECTLDRSSRVRYQDGTRELEMMGLLRAEARGIMVPWAAPGWAGAAHHWV